MVGAQPSGPASNRAYAGQLKAMPIYLIVGIGAGLASALLFASATTGGLFARLFLFLLAPLPGMLAGLGWGWLASAAAAVAGSALVAGLAGPAAGGLYFLTQALPVVGLCYLAYLNRPRPPAPGPEPQAPSVEWYPPGRLVAAAAIMAGGIATVLIVVMG